MKDAANKSENKNSIPQRKLDRQLHRAFTQRRRSLSHTDAPESDNDQAKTTCFFCETNPFFRTGAIKNEAPPQKTNPNEPIFWVAPSSTIWQRGSSGGWHG